MEEGPLFMSREIANDLPEAAEKIVSKVAQRLSTGKLLANIARATPNVSIAVSTMSRFASTVHSTPGCPSPEILIIAFGQAASFAIACFHATSPRRLRSLGNPV